MDQLIARESTPTSSPATTSRLWLAGPIGLWAVVGTFVLLGVIRSVQVDVPFRDPHGAYWWSRVELTASIFVGCVLLEGIVRAGLPLSPARVWSVIREKWTVGRLVYSWGALLAYHATYLTYHNLKSWNDLRTPRDGMLLDWDRALFFGHSPAVLIHDLLGEHVAAWILFVWYETFPTLVVVAFPACVALAKRVKDAYVCIAAFVWVWMLGTGTYYLIPSLGPFHSAPQEFSGLPHMPIQDTQARYMGQWENLRADPHAHDAFAQVAAFASLHVGVAAVILGVVWWHRMRLATIAMTIFVAGTMVATVYLGWHFFVDDLAGLAIAALAWILGPPTVGVRRRPVRSS
ncbi:phosphatase PAP2 family protein [Nocardioides jejuensis]|uniref:phosphatase PAP2 family protein n=1 Tax=Nocardioides jejuensis TaxID=2502782 RepID=UPI001FB33DF0|nr:phosphatase PAP2 family protein [Nocardioides jejuensis]